MSLKVFLSSVSVACLLAISAQAAEPLSPRVEVGVKGGTDRSLLTTEFWAPLAQKSDRVLYGDIRLMGDNDENREGNLGLGYRQVVDDAVLGVHGWIDRRRTQNNSTFHQLTFGVERLGHVVDARANVYVPLNQSRNITTPNIGQASPYLAGTGIFFDTNGLLQETPQYGLDGEVGYRIPVFQKHVDAIRVYGGGYHFFRDETQDVTGFRVRTEAQVNSAFSVGARFQHDDPRGSQGFLEATIKFPFGAKKLYQTDYLRARLDESPERDVDIVTAARQIDSGLGKVVLNAGTGEIQRVIHVDNSNTNPDGGDGSLENPFSTLKAAEAVIQDNNVVYINYGTGTTLGMDQGIVIAHDNVSLIGSGSDFIWHDEMYTSNYQNKPHEGVIIRSADRRGAPAITNSNVPLNVTEAATIGAGIQAINVANPYVSGIKINNARGNGMTFNIMDGGARINNMEITNAGYDGIFVGAYGGNIDQIIIDNIYVSGSGNNRYGIAAFASGANVVVNKLQISNAVLLDNPRNLVSYANTGAKIETLHIENVKGGRAFLNTGYAVQIDARGNGQIGSLIVKNFEQSNASSAGIRIGAISNTSILEKAVLSDIVSHDNAAEGLLINIIGSSRINQLSLSSSSFYQNGTYGVRLVDTSTDSMMLNLSGNNRFFDNTTAELSLDLDGATLSATHNWWGQAGGPVVGQIVNENSSNCPAACGSADTSQALNIDPAI